MSAIHQILRLPHNIEAEQAVIGAILFDNSVFPRVEDLVFPWTDYGDVAYRARRDDNYSDRFVRFDGVAFEWGRWMDGKRSSVNNFRQIGNIPPEITVIPTQYKGVTYRSRTESRWALWFDNLNIKAIYEPEGYILDGILYLPDFYIPSWNLFVEVKGKTPTEAERQKCSSLARVTGSHVILVVGDPANETGELFARPVSPEGPDVENVFFAMCRKCKHIDLAAVLIDGHGFIPLSKCPLPDFCGERYTRPGNKLESISQLARNYHFGRIA